MTTKKSENEVCNETNQMDWLTYVFLNDFLENQKLKLHNQYLVTSDFIDYDKEAVKKAYTSYQKKCKDIKTMQRQLKYAAGMSHGPNASKEMKEFWGLS